MNFLEIINEGEIDVNAFTLIGASTKRDDNTKIGFFGSGLKYAISVLMRNNIPMQVYSGIKQIFVETKDVTFRDQAFKMITIDGKDTSLTTEMGPTWELWHAIREVYCNAIDEGCHFLKLVDVMVPEEGKTKIYLGINAGVSEIINAWDNYFSENRTDLHAQKDLVWKVFFSKEKFVLYRKGIRCYDSEKKSLYDYDLFKVDINESRTVDSIWNVKTYLGELWAQHATVGMIENLFDMFRAEESKLFIEAQILWTYTRGFNDNWLKVVNGRKLIPVRIAGHFLDLQRDGTGLCAPSPLINSLRAVFGEQIKIAGKGDDYNDLVVLEEMTKKQEYLLKQVLEFFEGVNFNITYDIKVAVFDNKTTMGCVSKENILIADSTFEMGKKVIAATILEEAFHLESGKKDETRSFQDFLINKLLTVLENKTGVFL